MDKFKIRGGDFIGIIIPGIYLVMNIVMLFTFNISNILDFFEKSQLKEDIGIFFLLLIISYITGSALRLLSTDFPDRLSAKFRLSIEYIKNSLNYYILSSNKQININQNSLKGYIERFPFFEWYFRTCLNGLSIKAKEFFKTIYIDFNPKSKSSNNVLNNKRNSADTIIPAEIWKIFSLILLIVLFILGIFLIVNKINLIKTGFLNSKHIIIIWLIILYILLWYLLSLFIAGKTLSGESIDPVKKHVNYKYFFNNSKLEIINLSQSLGEEILNAEGLARMSIGMFYASFLSIISIIIKLLFFNIAFVNSSPGVVISINFLALFTVNLIIFLVFTWGVHQVRVREAAIVFTSIAILKTGKKQ